MPMIICGRPLASRENDATVSEPQNPPKPIAANMNPSNSGPMSSTSWNTGSRCTYGIPSTSMSSSIPNRSRSSGVE